MDNEGELKQKNYDFETHFDSIKSVLMTVILMMEAVQDLKIMAFSSTLIRLIA
jgi:hypothetical protein